MTTRYQPHIDGLRAIAVVLVILFHLGVSGVPGGFVGVDVFFVISGFLITRLIRDDVAAGSFGFGRFYLRRLRRLAPALLATLALCVPFASWLFTPLHLKNFGASLLAALGSVSNFYFWADKGYFNQAAEVQPLLHTWSLGVEEQFYLVWPLLLVLLLRARRPWLAPGFIAIVGVVGLVASELAVRHDSRDAFFLPHYRVAEFAVGAILVWLPPRWAPRGPAAEASAILGIALIVASALAYSSWTPFPGVAALAPCLGAALLIVAGAATRSAAILRNPLAAWIGRISYSLYLVHWPVIVFYGYAVMRPPEIHESAGLAALSVALAALMHRYVETPFRHAGGRPGLWPERGFASAAAVVAAVAAMAAAALWISNGWVGRYPDALARSVVTLPRAIEERAINRPAFGRRFTTDRPNVLLVGDSQAGDVLSMLQAAGIEERTDLSFLRMPAVCGSLLMADADVERYVEVNARIREHGLRRSLRRDCRDRWAALRANPLVGQADIVLIAHLWYRYQLPYVAGTVAELKRLGAGQIVVLGAKTMGADSVRLANHCLTDGQPFRASQACLSPAGLNRLASGYRDADAIAINGSMRAVSEAAGAVFIDMQDVVCPVADRCDLFGDDGTPHLFDRFHTADAANRVFGARLMHKLASLLAPATPAR